MWPSRRRLSEEQKVSRRQAGPDKPTRQSQKNRNARKLKMQHWARIPIGEKLIQGQTNLKTDRRPSKEPRSMHERKVDDRSEAESQIWIWANLEKWADLDAECFRQVEMTNSDKPTQMTSQIRLDTNFTSTDSTICWTTCSYNFTREITPLYVERVVLLWGSLLA